MTTVLDETKLEQIDREASITPLTDIVVFLRDHVGQKFTAYMSGLNDPKEVGAWTTGKVKPQTPKDMRLRYAYRVVRMLVESYGDDTAKAWLFGTNTRLNDEAPAYLLRHAQVPDDFRDIVPVARAFAGASE